MTENTEDAGRVITATDNNPPEPLVPALPPVVSDEEIAAKLHAKEVEEAASDEAIAPRHYDHAAHFALQAQVDAFIHAAAIWSKKVPTIQTAEQAERLNDYLTGATRLKSAIETQRKLDKKPWDDRADQVQAVYAPLTRSMEVTQGWFPKGVMLTHLNMVSACWSVSTYLGYRGDDVVLCALPLAFDYGLYQVLMAVRVGATLVLERGFTFPVKVLEVMARERCTVFPGVPTMFSMLMALKGLSQFDLSALRMITNTAAALSEGHIERLRALFPKAELFSMYGLTECKRVTYLPPEQLDLRPTSVGRGMPNEEVWLVDEVGRRLPNGSTGELVIRGSNVMRGYWEKPEETAKRLRPGPFPGEMILYSGDLFRTDNEGWLYFVARKDDIIKSRGEKVSPREVENAIHALDGVYEVVVIGVHDDVLGEAIKAFVVLKPEVQLTEREVIKHCLSRLESFMAPKHVEFVAELPKTDTGKIKKTGLV